MNSSSQLPQIFSYLRTYVYQDPLDGFPIDSQNAIIQGDPRYKNLIDGLALTIRRNFLYMGFLHSEKLKDFIPKACTKLHLTLNEFQACFFSHSIVTLHALWRSFLPEYKTQKCLKDTSCSKQDVCTFYHSQGDIQFDSPLSFVRSISFRNQMTAPKNTLESIPFPRRLDFLPDHHEIHFTCSAPFYSYHLRVDVIRILLKRHFLLHEIYSPSIQERLVVHLTKGSAANFIAEKVAGSSIALRLPDGRSLDFSLPEFLERLGQIFQAGPPQIRYYQEALSTRLFCYFLSSCCFYLDGKTMHALRLRYVTKLSAPTLEEQIHLVPFQVDLSSSSPDSMEFSLPDFLKSIANTTPYS